MLFVLLGVFFFLFICFFFLPIHFHQLAFVLGSVSKFPLIQYFPLTFSILDRSPATIGIPEISA